VQYDEQVKDVLRLSWCPLYSTS